jgi:8-oxo-dGTP pyrophosphatase MutT (NUDIX family)
LSSTPDAIPAATVIIIREHPGMDLEVLMVERSATLAFAGGCAVFPGGRIDPPDYVLAASFNPLDIDEAAARIAGIRETIEEVGVPLGLVPSPDESELAYIRDALLSGCDFGEVLDASGMRLLPESLVPWSRWRPAHAHKRVFDTRFYLARFPVTAFEPSVNEGESASLMWVKAATLLNNGIENMPMLMYPTRRNLERLLQFSSFATAELHARSIQMKTITPWLEMRDGIEHLCIPSDSGYPVTSQPFSTAIRG